MKLLMPFIKVLIVIIIVMIEFIIFIAIALLVLISETVEDLVKYFVSKK